jgi:NAD(P)-dependent dehydrogenase (short-subunit alcohol dehydrogenase family)
MSSRTIVITGASSGIGANAAGRLAAAGWEVAVVGRNPERTAAVADSVGGTPFLVDFDSLDEVRGLADALARRYERIDVLANNAGGLVPRRGVSADGHERTLQHNHLAPFLLTNLLLPVLEKSSATVIGTASMANRFGRLRLDDLDWLKRPYLGGWQAYGTSKITTILFARELAVRTSLTAYSFHPGYVRTNFGNDSAAMRFGNWLSRGTLAISPEEGANPLVQLAAEGSDSPNGTYFDGLTPDGPVHPSANESGASRELWDASARLVGLV